MKKYTIFIITILVIIIAYVYISHRPKDYEVSYEKDVFSIKEMYTKDNKVYTFSLKNKEQVFHFLLEDKYSNRRKIVDNIEVINKDNITCVQIMVNKQVPPAQCYKGNTAIDPYLTGLEEFSNEKNQKISEYENITIYNDSYTYLVWNNYGITDILDKKEYKFLSNESYNNILSYQIDEFLLIADYDSPREFKKIYLYDTKKKKIDKIEFEYKISTSSYFMGNVGNDVYLFDRKNKVQYKININKKTISISSDDEGALYYDGTFKTEVLSKFVYNDLIFNKDNLYNYSLENKYLYLNLFGSDKKIKVTDKEINYLVYQNHDEIYYISQDTLYHYTPFTGENVLLSYFEWNFNYQNKVFVFNNN